jgi:predicted nucleic acid-binding protein
MSNIVVDSGIVVKWFTAEPYSTESIKVLNEYQNGSINLLAPDLMFAEFGNIVWKKIQFQGLSQTDGQLIIDSFKKLRFSITSNEILLDDAYQLALKYKRTVYDCLYLALSLREKCQFVTADEKFANAIGSSITNVIWIANWP